MKTIKKILYLAIMILGLLIIFPIDSNAAGSISLSSSKSSVTVGEEFSVSVKLSGASVATLTSRITVDTSKVDYVSGPSNTSFSNGRVIYTWTDSSGGNNPLTGGTIATFKFRAKATGSASFSVSGDFYTPDETSVNPSFSGTTVTIKEKESTPNPPSGGNENGGNAGNGGGTGETGGGGSSGGSTGTGKPGTGGGQTTLSSNTNLKELHLSVEGLSPNFNKSITKYNIIVGNDINNINVTALAEDSNAKVNITGNTNLKSGVNNIKIEVVAQDNKAKKTYLIDATKTDNPDLANASLENLAIENVTLQPEFSPDIIMYVAEVGSDVENLNILAVPQIEGADVKIEGKDNLQFGDNVVTIKVVAKDGATHKEYLINVHKKTKEEESMENEIEKEEKIEQEEKNKVGIGNIVICYIVVIGVGVISYMLITKYRKENGLEP